MGIVNPPTVLAKLVTSRPFRLALSYLLAWTEPLVPRWGCVAQLGPSGSKEALLMDASGNRRRI